MSTTLSLTESQTLAAMRSFLLGVLPPTVEVIRGQDNLVPEPGVTDFVTMTTLFRMRLETNVHLYTDGYPNSPGANDIMSPRKVSVQLDVHGPNSADNAEIIATLFRDEYGVSAFALSGYDVTPLYCDTPHQIPFLNENQQIEERWVVDAHVQTNPIITLSQDFAAALDLDLVSVDATYPP